MLQALWCNVIQAVSLRVLLDLRKTYIWLSWEKSVSGIFNILSIWPKCMVFSELKPESLTWNMFVSELDVDDVVSRFCWFVGYAAWTILVVMAFDVGFAGALNGQAQTTIAWNGEFTYR